MVRSLHFLQTTSPAFPVLLLFSFSLLILGGCGNQDEENTPPDVDDSLTGQVQTLVDDNRYEEALELLRAEDASQTEVAALLRDTHLLYGNWLMYHAADIHMTERMPRALAHFRRVLDLDPRNSQARANKDQIEEIYKSMGRPIPRGVAE